MNVYVNGQPTPHRPFRENEYNPLMRHVDDDVRRIFLVLGPSNPCMPGDNITCDPGAIVPAACDYLAKIGLQPYGITAPTWGYALRGGVYQESAFAY